VVVLLLPLSLAMDGSEFDNVDGGGILAAAAAPHSIQWRQWQGL
jgi:hypothetical protein